jgi:hypothetical protein
MQKEITPEQLKAALAGDRDKLIDEVVQVVDAVQPGRIIAATHQPTFIVYLNSFSAS